VALNDVTAQVGGANWARSELRPPDRDHRRERSSAFPAARGAETPFSLERPRTGRHGRDRAGSTAWWSRAGQGVRLLGLREAALQHLCAPALRTSSHISTRSATPTWATVHPVHHSCARGGRLCRSEPAHRAAQEQPAVLAPDV